MGVWSGELQDPADPTCLRLVIHAVSNALGVNGNGLAVQGTFVDCATGQPVVSGFAGTGRVAGTSEAQFDVGLSVIAPNPGVPQKIYQLALALQSGVLTGTWRLRDDPTSAPIPIRLNPVAVNTGGLAGLYVVMSVRAPLEFPVTLVPDTMQLGARGSLYHARCNSAALGEYNRTGDAVAVRQYFPTCDYRPFDTLYIESGNLTRRRIYVRVANPTLRDTVEEIYVRR
jgi:hypothetical protein